MTDNEIVKALEICNSLSLRCGNGCPYYDKPYKNGKRCSEMMIEDTLDLINRQKAEIERLRTVSETEIVQKAKSEAYKEFSAQAKALISKRFKKVIDEEDIDILEKRLAGD